MQNPFEFRAYDPKHHKEVAVNYYGPKKREQMKNYLSGSSVNLTD